MVHSQLNVDVLVSGYTQGFFPMADWDGIYWHSPDPRAIIPLNKVPDKPRSLKQYEKKHNYQFTINYDFEQVIKQCAERKDTWISESIPPAFKTLGCTIPQPTTSIHLFEP